MADTSTSYFAGVAFAAAKNMGGILNSHATELIKIRRVGLLNAQTAAVTGVLCQLQANCYRTAASLSGATAVTPVQHDSTNTAFTTATVGHAGTVGGTALIMRQIFWSSDEAAISTGTSDELETYVPLNTIFDAGYGDSTNVQPLVLRQTQMFLVYNTTGAAGLLDTWIEATRE